jgi:hypothetical protein
MKLDRRQFAFAAPLLLGSAASLAAQERAAGEPQDITVRGRIVCLTEELQKLYQVLPDCATRGHVYTLKTGTGQYYPLLPTDSAAAVWLDERYRQRELQVVARRFPPNEFIEVIKYQAWRDGKLYDLEYHCVVCNISVHKPGPCECCQDPVEFREVPAQEAK